MEPARTGHSVHQRERPLPLVDVGTLHVEICTGIIPLRYRFVGHPPGSGVTDVTSQVKIESAAFPGRKHIFSAHKILTADLDLGPRAPNFGNFNSSAAAGFTPTHFERH